MIRITQHSILNFKKRLEALEKKFGLQKLSTVIMEKIHIGNNFTGNYNLTILDIREVYI